MDKAHAMGIQKPKVILDNIRLQFVNREGRNCGTIAITCDNDYYSRTFYGRILLDGKLLQTRAMTDEVLAELKKLDADPQKVASEFGQMHSTCCFCNKELSDNRSVAVGYGKTCAHNYGLPWGEKEFKLAEEPAEEPKGELAGNHKFEDAEYGTIEYDAQYQQWNVYAWGRYPSHSVLAGQAQKSFVGSYETREQAIREVQGAELEFQIADYKIDAGNTVDHLPDDGDDGWDQRDCVHFDMGR
jgi:hypothetical protein